MHRCTRMAFLKVDELCDFLTMRGLPVWIVTLLHEGLEASVDPDALTEEQIKLTGIAHPLHQRRILREVQCMQLGGTLGRSSWVLRRRLQEHVVPPEVPEGPGMPKPLVPRPPRRLVYERDMRWPYLDIGCLKPLQRPTKTGPYQHGARRAALAEEVEINENLFEATLSKESLPKSAVASVHIPYEEEETIWEGADWEDWLQSRLHDWGPLYLVDEVLKTAALGNLTELKLLLQRVKSHGSDFLESLDTTPLPTHLLTIFPDVEVPKTIGAWIQWRLKALETADRSLGKMLDKAMHHLYACAGNLRDARAVGSLRPSQEGSLRPGQGSIRPGDRK